MTRQEPILGGFAYKCDMCDENDGRATIRWNEKDFDLCYICLGQLFFDHLAADYKTNELVKIRRMSITESLRNKVMLKCNNQCVKCFSTERLEVDHILPFSLGGKTEIDNLQILCKTCNLKKGNGK